MIPAILVPEPEVAFQILALNTEKAHNLKEKSLEVIRMYRGLVDDEPRGGEEDYAFQFEAPHFITLGLLYEENKRFAGGAFAPILRRVDKFLKGRFPKTLEEREERAELVRAADEALGGRGRQDQEARDQPPLREELRPRADHARSPASARRCRRFEQTFEKLVDNIEGFDVAKVRYEDIQRSAIMARARGGLDARHGAARPSSPTAEIAARLRRLPGWTRQGRQAPPRASPSRTSSRPSAS